MIPGAMGAGLFPCPTCQRAMYVAPTCQCPFCGTLFVVTLTPIGQYQGPPPTPVEPNFTVAYGPPPGTSWP